MSMVGN